jgi:hypothetical protein
MASTVTPTTFKITISEEQVVGNNLVKNTNVLNITNVTNVDRRVVTCPNTTSINLFNINGINPGAGTFPSSSLKYARITNLDNTYSAAVIISGSQGTYTQKLTPTSSIFVASSNITSSNFNGSFGDNINSIKIYAISSSIDIGYTLVNA